MVGIAEMPPANDGFKRLQLIGRGLSTSSNKPRIYSPARHSSAIQTVCHLELIFRY
jgi:hypothetical protein